VLISMGILTLGLLGAAALFPVGGYYMQKAVIADNGSALAQAVMSDVVARGIVNPKAWMVYIPNANGTKPYQLQFPSDGIFTSNPGAKRGTFTRPFARTLGEALTSQPTASTDGTLISRQFGNAYVIDPLYVAKAVERPSQPSNLVAYGFPASAAWTAPGRTAPAPYAPYYLAPEWEPWKSSTTSLTSFDRVWPIRRVSLQDASGWQMDVSSAEHYFVGNDDLAADLPTRDDRAARQNWDAVDLDGDGDVDPLGRQWTGDYSWIVCVVPTTNDARNGLARNPEAYSYEVSVVVFYKRALPSTTAFRSSQPEAAGNERTVAASVVSTGLNGGEVLLRNVGDNATNPFEQLRKGEWMMLCGPHPTSTVTQPRFFLNWYQVLSIENERSDIINDPTTERLVAVRGPEWPWQPAASGDLRDYYDLPNSVCGGIFRGAVAVHTRTMRLESARGGAGMALSPGPTVPPPPLTTDL
jgi:hypothetical protein